MVASTWEGREQVILEALADHEATGQRPMTSDDVAEATGLDGTTTALGLIALVEADYVEGHDASSAEQVHDWFVSLRLREKGRRAAKQWPPEGAAEVLQEIIDNRIAAATDPEEKSRLVKLRDGLAGVGKGVLTSVLAEFAKNAIG